MAACDTVRHYRSGPLEVLDPGAVSVRSSRNPTRAELPKLRTVVDDSCGSLRNPHSVAPQLAFYQDRGRSARGCTCASARHFLSRCVARAHGRAFERFLRSSSALVERTAGRTA